ATGFGEGDEVADVVALQWLDLDNPGAQVGEQGRAVRSGEHTAELQHRHARQRRCLGAYAGPVGVGGRERHDVVVLADSRCPPKLGQWFAVGMNEGRRLAYRTEIGGDDAG